MSEEKTPYVVSTYEPADQRQHPIFRMFARSIAFHPEFVKLTGSVVAAVMLSQAVYWSQRTNDSAGWFYKTMEEWEEETGLKRSEQETARKHLRKMDFWQEELRKANGAPTLHFRINASRFAETLQTHLLDSSKSDLSKSSKSNCGIPANPITETTTETTTKSTNIYKGAKRPKAAPHPMTQSIIDAYIKALGYTPSQETMTRHVAPTAKEIAKREITPEQIEQTYAIMADEEFWKDKTISLSKVLDRIEKTKATIRNRKEGEDGRSQDSQDDHLGGWTSEEIATVRRLRSEGKNDECGAYIRAAEERRRQARMSKV